ncbi:hypothetical protein DFJ63DRAFT_221487 [Scheffersomyces coipomensis]|uniref:uncharacterized protein n=1 Tax=Scheffersomyces coipomensis TaxID=1788519 RepID=UPI00315CC012
MGTFNYSDNSIEGDVYIQRLATYIRRNEEALANGLLCFSKNKNTQLKVKPLRLTFSIHHLYYITERIENSSLGVDVGPLNVKLDNPNHEPTFISFMANNARSSKHFDSDTRSISSINSMKSIVSSASVYWRSFAFSKDPKIINKDIKYLYSSFTKIPCLILTPKTKINSISSYEEYPCDTSVPVKMFKNLQVLEIIDYDPNEIFGWHILSEQLRILIIRNSKISNVEEVLFNLIIDDEMGRSSFNTNTHKPTRKYTDIFTNSNISSNPLSSHDDSSFSTINEINEFPAFNNNININNNAFRYPPKRERATTTITNGTYGGAGPSSLPKDLFFNEHISSSSTTNHNESTNNNNHNNRDYQKLPDSKWSFLKQLTICETSITSIPAFIFRPLGNLVKLNLSNNLLQDLPDGLDQLINIKYLNFADNYITNLRKLPKNLKYLSTLNFNNNKLTSIIGLENLQNLEKIDLRRNNLQDSKTFKPIILQFIKNPSKFDNVYLSGNTKLSKTYRSDLFNLFNGVKYKNNMKIDDSRPGYFESALLLDAESAFKNLEKFFSEETVSASSTASPKVKPNAATDVSIPSTPETKAKVDKENTTIIQDEGLKSDDATAVASPNTQPSPLTTHARSSTLDTLLEPFAGIKLSDDSNDENPKKKFDLSHSIITTSPTILQSDSVSVHSLQKQSSPLGTNRNLTNKGETTLSNSISKPHISVHLSNPSSGPNSPSGLKKSSTLVQLDIEGSNVNTTAPNIVTQVQVTARMST